MKLLHGSLLSGAAVIALLALTPDPGLARSAPTLLAQAPAQGQAQAAKPFTTEQLDQMMAPIALYPDALLAQVMMASTYPLEVVEAARWSKANPSLKGDAAVKAVQDKGWDVSVKSLVAFPSVVQQMSDQLDWTQKLGDAMLAQHTEVAGSIQRLRKRAYDAENLKTTPQQTVKVEPVPAAGGATQQTIVIQPTDPTVVYVPVYQPAVTYGPWPYPSYPPYYYPPYPGYGYGAALATGFVWGAAIAGGGAFYGGWGWNAGNVNVDINRAVNVDRNINRSNYQGGNWNHSPEHRKGVAYRDNATRQQYGKSVQGADARQQFRGKDVQSMGSAGQRQGAGVGGGAQQRPGSGAGVGGGAQQRPGGSAGLGGSAQQRPGGGAGVGGGAQQRPAATQQRQSAQHQGAQHQGAFQGMDRGGQSMNREMSRGQSSFSGGGGRAGGGGGRSGGGRR